MTSPEEKTKELTEFIFQISHRFQFMESDLIGLSEIDLNILECNVIEFLGRKGSSIMREIADYSKLAVSTTTGIVDKLVQKGLVERGRIEEDRRVVKVELTEKGWGFKRWHFEQHMQLSKLMLQSLSEEDQETLLALMRKIVHGLKDNLDSTPGES